MKEWYIYSPQVSWLYNQNLINKIILAYTRNYYIFVKALFKSYWKVFGYPMESCYPTIKGLLEFTWKKPYLIKHYKNSKYCKDSELEEAARLMIKEIVERKAVPVFEEIMYDPISKDFKAINLSL